MRSLALAMILFAACGKADTSGAHCVLGKACDDYGSAATDLPAHAKDCKALTGSYEVGRCPRANLVGECVTDKNLHRSYYTGGANAFTEQTGAASCEHEFHGVWTAR
ncbi:hypothetical protein BH11MYX1_BH11MYX1_38670 [soil metagenome]